MTDHKQTQVTHATHITTAIVIRGLPGIGKTTLANEVAERLEISGNPCFQINADDVRISVSKGLGFSLQDRVEHARRIGAMAWLAQSQGYIPVIDFVMPTKQTFDAFQDGLGSTQLAIFTLKAPPGFECRFPDTQKMFEPIQDWWGGAVISAERLINPIDPYPQTEIVNVAEKIIDTFNYFNSYKKEQ